MAAEWRSLETGGHAYPRHHAHRRAEPWCWRCDAGNRTGFDKVSPDSRLGRRVRALLESRGFPARPPKSFQAPGVVVGYASEPEGISNRPRISRRRPAEPPAGVPLQCGRRRDFRTFRIGLLGWTNCREPARGGGLAR